MHIQQAIDRAKDLLQRNVLDERDIPDSTDVTRIMGVVFQWMIKNEAWTQLGLTEAEARAQLCDTFNQWLYGEITVTL